MTPGTRLSLLLILASASVADEIVLPETVVRASRAEQSLQEIPAHVTVLSDPELNLSPAQSTDDLLRQVPGFSLFRRSSSVVAHPTSQGVSLRGIGASGASRALVLLDGMPLNDPFGGWVQWSKVEPQTLERAEILRGGGSHIWGNYALSGVVNLVTQMPRSRSVRLHGGLGNGSTNKVGVSLGDLIGRTAVNVAASMFDTDGYFVLRENHRGSIDEPARSEHGVLSARLSRPLGNSAHLFFQSGVFQEERGNGTPLMGNSTEAGYLNMRTTWTGRSKWTFSGFFQKQRFESSFSSQAADRETERPALDQFRVPATAVGLTIEWLRPIGDQVLVAGSDLRQSTGQTNERYRNLGDGFTRRRRAGGTQQFAGFFLQDVIRWKSRWQFTLGSRIDYWRFSDGSRREFDLEAGGILRDDDYDHRTGLALGPKAGVRYQVNPRFVLRSSAYRTFRTPTLNELYRPFRVRNDITEANRRLEPEQLTGGEVGIDANPEFVRLRVTGYWNEVEDAIGNLTVGFGPGQVAPCGFVPEGGSCRQRGNLERTRIRGLEVDVSVLDRDGWSLSISYLFSDSEIRRATQRTELEGRQLAQVPKHRFQSTLRYIRPTVANFSLALRYAGKQFKDDLNSLVLSPYATVDMAARKELSPHYNLFAKLENLLDSEIEVGRSGGLVGIGAPRRVFLGVQARMGK